VCTRMPRPSQFVVAHFMQVLLYLYGCLATTRTLYQVSSSIVLKRFFEVGRRVFRGLSSAQ
jgi:hypothetical protein